MTLRVAVIGISAGLVVACAASPARAYQEAPVTGGGTIKGKVVYNGEIPIRTVVPTKDQQVCGGVREEPEVKVGADNGVGDAIVYLKEVEQGKAWPAAAQAPTLDNKDCIFTPAIQAIPAGKLNVHNSDPVLHNTHGFYGRRTAFNIALPNQGQTIEVDLPRAGTGQDRVRRPRLDARLGLRGRQPVLRADGRGRDVRDHRGSARRLHADRQPGLHRTGRGRRDGRRQGRPPRYRWSSPRPEAESTRALHRSAATTVGSCSGGRL